MGNKKELPRLSWLKLIPDSQWQVYKCAIEAIRQTELPFMLGGGFALGVYIDRWRNTKDIDFYILPEKREAIIRTLSEAGFTDYYDQLPYDRGWIYRSFREGVIVDLIWSMANRRAQVDAGWFHHAKTVALRGENLQVIPPEELFWCKLYVFQRDHCDWPDLFNLLHATGASLDWPRLLELVGSDFQLLKGALTLFDWLSPDRTAEFAAEVRERFQLPPHESVSPEEERRRAKLLDTRGWFAPLLSEGAPLEV